VQDEHGWTASTNLNFLVQDFTPVSSEIFDERDLWADLDQDGWLDTLGNGKWRRNGNAPGISPFLDAFYDGPVRVAFDANNDGSVDFVTTGLRTTLHTTTRIGQRIHLVSTNLPRLSGSGLGTIDAIDYDLDGDTDILDFDGPTGSLLILRNEGNLSFTALPTVRTSGLSAAWTDFDLDGDPDFFLPFSASTNVLYSGLMLNDGTGRFTNSGIVLPANSTASSIVNGAWGDYNLDGRPDLYISNTRGEFLIYVQNADHSLSLVRTIPRAGSIAQGVDLADLDNDGRPEICTMNSDLMFSAISVRRTSNQLPLPETSRTWRDSRRLRK
jgi:hypothetical protein